MKTMIRKILGPGTLALVLATSGWAQGSSQPQEKPKPPVQPGQTTEPAKEAAPATPATPPINPEEEAAFKAFAGLTNTDAQAVVKQGEDFLNKYPSSRYAGTVYSRLANAYLSSGLEDKMFVAGEKALELNPNDVDVLALMALVVPRRVDTNSLDANQKLQKAEDFAKHGIALLGTLQKPAGLTDEQFQKARDEKLAMCHSGLGLVYFDRGMFPEATAELEQATKLPVDPDPVDFFLLGMAYERNKDYANAKTAFTHCSENPNAIQNRCKAGLEEVKKLEAIQPKAPKP